MVLEKDFPSIPWNSAVKSKGPERDWAWALFVNCSHTARWLLLLLTVQGRAIFILTSLHPPLRSPSTSPCPFTFPPSSFIVITIITTRTGETAPWKLGSSCTLMKQHWMQLIAAIPLHPKWVFHMSRWWRWCIWTMATHPSLPARSSLYIPPTSPPSTSGCPRPVYPLNSSRGPCR